MPLVSDAGRMYSLLIGISCLEDEKAERLQEAWEYRFSSDESSTLLIRTDKTVEEFDVRQSIWSEMKVRGMNPQDVIVAYFVDGLDEEQVDFAVRVRNIGERLGIGCNVNGDYLFEYVGVFAGFSDEDKEKLIQRLSKTAIDRNITILVGRRPIDDPVTEWHAEMAFLDVNCRNHNLFTTTFDLGFLRYSRWNEDKRRMLVKHKEELEEELGSHGEERFREELISVLKERIEQPVMDNCRVYSEVVPVLPEAIKQGFCLFKSDLTVRAKEKVRAAVTATSLDAERYVFSICDSIEEGQYEQILRQIIEKARVGLGLLSDREAFCKLISFEPEEKKITGLSFEKENDLKSIQKKSRDFLEGALCVSVDVAKALFVEKLRNSFHNISQNEIDQKKLKLSKDLKNVEEKLRDLPEEKAYYDEVLEGKHCRGAFSPVDPNLLSQEKRFLLFGKTKFKEHINEVPGGKVTPVFYTDDLDYKDAEAVGVLLYEVSASGPEKILKDLIK